MADGDAPQQALNRFRLLTKPEPFSDGDFDLWLKRFEVCASANEWDESRKCSFLPTMLSGRAFNTYDQLQAVDKLDYQRMKTALSKAFLPPQRQLIYMADFRSRAQRSSESLDEFAFQLGALLSRAVPNLDEAAHATFVLDQFLLGINPL